MKECLDDQESNVDGMPYLGQYNMSAVPSMTWLLSNISSEGVRDMSISLDNVTIGAEVGVGLGSLCTSGAYVKCVTIFK